MNRPRSITIAERLHELLLATDDLGEAEAAERKLNAWLRIRSDEMHELRRPP